MLANAASAHWCQRTFYVWAAILTLLLLAVTLGAFSMARRQAEKNAAGAIAAPHPVCYNCAKDSVGFIKDWAVWLVGVQTGAMAAIGFLAKTDLDSTSAFFYKAAGVCAMWFLGLSVLSFSWLLGSLPSVRMRLLGANTADTPVAGNDIYVMKVFSVVTRPYHTVEYLAALAHELCVIGLTSFALFFGIGVVAPRAASPDPVAAAIEKLGARLPASPPAASLPGK